MNWLTTGHSGRACKEDAVYTKINKRTGKVTSSKLCHPYDGDASQKQIKQRSRFGLVSKACQDLIKEGKNGGSEKYDLMLKAYNSQRKCGSMLGFMMQKIQDTRPGKTESEYRAIIKGWIEDVEGGNTSTGDNNTNTNTGGSTPGGSTSGGSTPGGGTNTGSDDDYDMAV